MSKRVCFYGEPMTIPRTFVRDEITAQPKKRTPELEAKLSQVVDLLEKLVAENRREVTNKKKSQRREQGTDSLSFLQDAIRQAAFEAACEATQTAYAARNPHKAQKDAPQETRVQYPHKPRQREPWEDRLSVQDGANHFLFICEQSHNAYAARNPHKRGK